MNEIDLLKIIALKINNWKNIAIQCGFHINDITKCEEKGQTSFEQCLLFLQTIVWIFLKDILKNNEPDLVSKLEKEFSSIFLSITHSQRILDFPVKKQFSKSNGEIDIPKEISERISQWRAFGRVLGFEEYHLRQIGESFQRCKDRNYELIRVYTSKVQPSIDNHWLFWKRLLLQYQEGIQVIVEMETVFPQLFKDADSICHASISKDRSGGFIFHQYMSIEKNIQLPFSKTKEIGVNIGGNGIKILHYQDYDEWINHRTKYMGLYKMFNDMRTFDFTNILKKKCPILQTLETFFNKTGDQGFAVKGYSLKDHYSMFGEFIFPKDILGKNNIIAYFHKDNIIMHIKICDNPNSISLLLNSFMQDVKLCESVHTFLQDGSIIHVGIVLIDFDINNNHHHFCKECIANNLLLHKNEFCNFLKFKKLYDKIVKNNCIFKGIQKELQLPSNILSRNKICKYLQGNIIAYLALKSVDFPTFTKHGPIQIQELKKLVLLSGCQLNILYSDCKHMVIRGGYGSGKSIVLHKKLENLLCCTLEKDVFYFICHDQMSKFSIQADSLQKKFPESLILVCNSNDLIQRSIRLSSILKQVNNSWKGRCVHLFIDEFNGSYLNSKEISRLADILPSFKNSFIVIATQSMEYIEKTASKKKKGFLYEELAEKTDFEFYNLDYSLRCSIEINEFVKQTIFILREYEVRIARLKDDDIFTSVETTVFDREFGLQYVNEYENSDKKSRMICNKYKYVEPADAGHTVSCGKISIYSISRNLHDAVDFNIATNKENGRLPMSSSLVILMLDNLLDSFSEKKVVICTFNADVYNNVYKMLSQSHRKWTNKINHFSILHSHYDVFLTDHASVRGFEFDNFVFILRLDQTFLHYRLIECFTRATTHLTIIFDQFYPDSEENRLQNELVNSWKTLDCVEWFEILYNRQENIFFCYEEADSKKNITPHRKTVLKKNYPDLVNSHFLDRMENRYPWKSTIKKEVDEHHGRNDIRNTLNVIFRNDSPVVLKEFVALHNLDLQTFFTGGNLGRTLLHWAAQYNGVKLSSALINDYKISLYSVDNDQRTALHTASKYDSDVVAEFLIDAGVNVSIKDVLSATPLHEAGYSNSFKVAKILLDRGASPLSQNVELSTPLHEAAMNNSYDVAKILFNHGTNANAVNNKNETALHIAAMYNSDQVAKILFNYGADVNAVNNRNETALHVAAMYDSDQVATVLLEKHAQIEYVNVNVQTPLDVALHYNNEKMVSLLLNHYELANLQIQIE